MVIDRGRRLEIAFHMNVGSGAWTAGVQYLANLFAALQAIEGTRIPKLVLLVPHSNRSEYSVPESCTPAPLKRYVDRVIVVPVESVRISSALTRYLRGKVRSLRYRLGLVPPWQSPLSIFLQEQRIDAVFSNIDFGAGFRIPLVVWIPDFQSRRLPEMFPSNEREALGLYRRRMIRHADRIVLSSHDAAKDYISFVRDFSSFVPTECAEKARVLPFVAQLSESVYQTDPVWICMEYCLPDKFIYLPNQFWKHKNHRVVIQALKKCRARGVEITVVCTGNTNDHRDPGFFGGLMLEISKEGVRDNMIMLGLVPREHLPALMRQSLAILQPSLFEGWSTTVEEAKSLGKSVVLSDIPVHREQNPPNALYFDPHSPEALADCLMQVFQTRGAGPDLAMEEQARRKLPERTKEYAEAFMRVVDECVASRKSDPATKRG